jgi:hypothetical protein
MGIFERYINAPEHKWAWYIGTLIGSFIPIILRFFISLDCEISSFDIKDLLFAGLAMNLANFNLIAGKEVENQHKIAGLSVLWIIFISTVLGVFFHGESLDVKKNFYGLKITSGVIVLISTLASYATNQYVFNQVNKIK